ncbi:MAG: DNA-binding response regulator [Chloroflexia bacterium]|nr:DNA-binding response regulator [Chloroflexia bacterium]
MSYTSPIKIMLVDDDSLILFTLRQIMRQYTNMEVVCTANDSREALTKLQVYTPDVILLDIQMPHVNGITCLREIRALYPEIVVILLTTFDDERYIIEGLASGARSYLLKTATFDNLAHYIHDALHGKFSLPAHIATKLAAFLQKKETVSRTLSPQFFKTYMLTRPEQQIVLLLSKRLSNREIAQELALHIGTVRNHCVAIFDKLNVRNRQEAITLIESQLV